MKPRKLSKTERDELAAFAQKVPRYRILDSQKNFKAKAYIADEKQLAHVTEKLIFKTSPVFTALPGRKVKYVGFEWSDPYAYVLNAYMKGGDKGLTQAMVKYMNKFEESQKKYNAFYKEIMPILVAELSIGK